MISQKNELLLIFFVEGKLVKKGLKILNKVKLKIVKIIKLNSIKLSLYNPMDKDGNNSI